MLFRVITGRVKRGRRVGRRLGFPTINVAVPRTVKKNAWGIYFSLVRIGHGLYPALTHLGPPKTFLLSRATCESLLLTLNKNLYGENVEIKLLFKFREVEQYPSVRHLKKQIKRDIKAARKFFGL